MDKKEKKSRRVKKGLDTAGKRLLVLTIAILMTFQFCTPTFSGVSFADEETAEAVGTVTEEVQADVQETETPVQEEQTVAPEVGDASEESAAEATVEEQPVETAPAETEPAPQVEPAAPAVTPEVTNDLNTTPMSLEVKTKGGVKVNVVAEAGTFPVGTQMKVTEVAADDVQGAVDSAMGGNATVLKAVDITFYNDKETDIQPAIPVKVKVTSNEFNAASDMAVVHITDAEANDAEVVALDENRSTDTTAAFNAEGFSVYVVVETGEDARLTVNFVRADGSTEKMMINKRQIPQIKEYIFDPGAHEAEGVIFKGWTTTKDYTSETAGLTIEQVRSEIKTKLEGEVTDGDEVTYYAMAFNQREVQYLDERGVVVQIDQELVRTDSTEDPIHEVSLDYTPYPAEDEGVVAQFVGWQQLTPEVSGEEVLYNPGDSFELEETLYVLKAKTENGHWVVFDENLSNATYTEPQFVALNGKATAPAAPTRAGYTFDGWYTEDADASQRDGKAAGTAFDFNNVVEKNTVLYGNWTQATSANYNVVFWFQQVDGEGYDYSGTTLEVRNATVGENTYTISQQGTGDNAYARVYTSASNYTNYNNFTGFHLDHFDAATAVKPDGTTVINVYYNRNTITYNFGSNSFSGLYGSAFTQWPDPGNNRVWQYTGNNMLLPLALTEFNPQAVDPNATGNTFNFRTTSYSKSCTLYVYKQKEDGTWSYTTDYRIATAALGNGGTWYPTETYTGYTIDGYRLDNTTGTWTSVTNDGSIDYTSGYYSPTYHDVYLRYARNKYKITYSDGVFVTGSGSPVTDAPSARTNFETKDNIYYEANINTADYNIKPTLNGYVFLGWYDNALCAGEPYTFDKMPANNVALYAKWGLREYAVNLHPNDSTSDPIQYTNPEQKTTFYADEGDKVGNVGGERIYNDLVGWYSDAAMTHSFNFDAMVVNQTTVEKYGTIYSESEIDPKYPTTVGELNLYAKWRSKLIGADGITVEYVDGAEGTSATATDESKYVDGSHANAHGAFTPADKDEYVFSHWEVQKWNGTAYESAGVNVFPGEAFEIKAADAKITDKDGNAKTIEELDKNEKYTYTIQLKAVYVEKDKEIKTSINWYNNYDGGKVATSEDIKINQATPIPAAPTRTGYEFKGWIRGFEEDGTTTTLTDLWLTYENGAYKCNGKAATHVAADEALVDDGTKHHALYAKWEAIDVDYTVEFYYQNDNGEGYTKDKTLTRQAKTDTTVNATDADKAQTKNDKYKLNAEESTLTATVAGDGTTVLKVYFDLNKVDVTVEHYLKGQATAFKTDTAADQIVGTTYTATAETTYQGKKLTVDSKKPESGSITVAAKDNLIKIYYTLPVTVTAADNEKVYGTEDPAFTATVDGTLGNDTVTYTVTRPGAGKDENVGTYKNAIVPAGEDAQGYYTVAYVPADFEITKAPASELGLKATGYENVYDAKDHAASATVTVTQGTTIEYSTDGGTNWSTTAPSIKNVGEQAVSVRATNPNYETATTSCTLKVTPAPVTVAAVNSTKTYGDADPEFTANVSGVLDDYTITYNVTRPGAGKDENVGTYTNAIVAAGAATQGNYTVTYKPADFEITAAGTLTVTATGYEGIYDAASHAATATASVTEGTKIEYSTDGGTTWSETAPSITDVGEQAVQVRATNPNYVTATASCTLKVDPKPVTVTAKAASKVYGKNDPTFEATVSGTIGSDTVSYKVTRPGAGKDENVGTYDDAIVPAGEATQGNYTVTYVPADFTITKAPASELGLTAEGYEGVYDANSHAASAEATVTEGTTIEFSTDGETWSTTAPTITNVGEQPVRVRAINPNYETATANCTLKVTPKPVTVTAVAASKTYGEADPAFTATVDGTLGTDTVTYTVTRPGAGKDENAGTYPKAIVAEGEATQGNYTVTYAPADFTINKAALTIKANDQTYTYNRKPQGEDNNTYSDASKVTVTGLKGSDALTSITLNGQETNAGEYAGKITASNAQIGKATDNYAITYEAGKLTINPVSDKVTVTITGKKASVDYNGSEQKVEGYNVSIINELYTEKDFTFSGNDVAKGTNKGTYNMGLAKDQFKNTNTNFTNIEFVVTDGELVIDPIKLKIESASDEKVYDGTALTNDNVKITEGKLAPTDELTNVKVTGSQTLVGTSKNTFTFDIDTKAEPASTAGKLLSALGLLGTAYGSEEVLANYDITKVEGDLTVTDKKVDPDKVITKTHEDKTYKVGETITFTIEATNIYAEKKDITLTEQEGVTLEKSEFKDVEPGAKIETTATYTVTEEDAKAGTFKNTVKITFSGVDDPIENTDEVKDFAHMTVTKAVTNKPADGKVFRTGETIKYEVTVTNDGTKELTDIVVKDELTGDEWKVDSLAAGKSKTFKAEYKVTDKDAAAGSVTNVATAEGKDPEGDTTPGNPGKVVTDTDKAIEPAPKTGDTTVIVPYIVIGVSALALLLMLLFRRRKAN